MSNFQRSITKIKKVGGSQREQRLRNHLFQNSNDAILISTKSCFGNAKFSKLHHQYWKIRWIQARIAIAQSCISKT